MTRATWKLRWLQAVTWALDRLPAPFAATVAARDALAIEEDRIEEERACRASADGVHAMCASVAVVELRALLARSGLSDDDLARANALLTSLSRRCVAQT